MTLMSNGKHDGAIPFVRGNSQLGTDTPVRYLTDTVPSVTWLDGPVSRVYVAAAGKATTATVKAQRIHTDSLNGKQLLFWRVPLAIPVRSAAQALTYSFGSLTTCGRIPAAE
jgi:hypothetical protein